MRIFLIAMLTTLFMNGFMTQAANAQDKYRPKPPKPPKLIETGIIDLPCTLYCRMQAILKILEDIELNIDIYLDFRFYLHLKDKSRLEEKLGIIENYLSKTEKVTNTLSQKISNLRQILSDA